MFQIDNTYIKFYIDSFKPFTIEEYNIWDPASIQNVALRESQTLEKISEETAAFINEGNHLLNFFIKVYYQEKQKKLSSKKSPTSLNANSHFKRQRSSNNLQKVSQKQLYSQKIQQLIRDLHKHLSQCKTALEAQVMSVQFYQEYLAYITKIMAKIQQEQIKETITNLNKLFGKNDAP